jgi:small nuclear ribonucleoprotein (snRNP)-like protein
MRTKQLRISDALQIKSRMPEFVGKKVNIVLSDSTAVFGELKKVSDSEIVLMNMRLEKVRYPFNSISEIYLDTIV